MMNGAMRIEGKSFSWAVHNGEHVGSADASTLGFAPGVWPVVVDVHSHRTGAVKRFLRMGLRRSSNEDSVTAVYTSDDGMYLHVYND
jgi:hypothetical protein